MPALVDTDPPGGGEPLSIFESGAILPYLTEKTGRFIPSPCSTGYGRDRAFVAGKDYSIADMAAYPWIVPYEA